MSSEVVVVAVVALLLFWWVGAYNRLVRLRSQAVQAFGALTVQLRRRHALAEGAATASADPAQRFEFVPAAPGGLSGAARQFGASLAAVQARPLDAQAMRSLGAANAVLLLAWERHFAEAIDTSGGDSRSIEWKAIEIQLEHANAEFDQAASAYNTAVRQFPAQIIASVFGLQLAGRFEN